MSVCAWRSRDIDLVSVFSVLATGPILAILVASPDDFLPPTYATDREDRLCVAY